MLAMLTSSTTSQPVQSGRQTRGWPGIGKCDNAGFNADRHSAKTAQSGDSYWSIAGHQPAVGVMIATPTLSRAVWRGSRIGQFAPK